MSTISAIIITKNEEDNIEQCLQSVSWMNEIIVVDSGSTDNTLNICRKYNAKVIITDWPGFGPQKNRALTNATSDWVFSIDADERISADLKAEILQIINTEKNHLIAYHAPRKNFVLNKPVKYCLGAKHDSPIRLLKKGYAKFTDDVVHEKIVTNDNSTDKIGILNQPLLHYPFPNLATLINKSNLYSTLGAKKLAAKNVSTNIFKILWHAKWAFIRMYFLKLGFLDGWVGFLIAFANAEETFYRYAKLYELNKQKLNEHI